MPASQDQDSLYHLGESSPKNERCCAGEGQTIRFLSSPSWTSVIPLCHVLWNCFQGDSGERD